MADLTLPEGSRLLHIGPHKTGTTAIQGAFRQSRRAMAEYGVVYPGHERQHLAPARAVTGIRGQIGSPEATPADWDRLVYQVSEAGPQRVVISSEFFDDADDAAARRVVSELGGPLVHVVVTLRPLTKILPSAWQQYVRNRLRVSYDDWLDAMFNTPPYEKPTRTFWRRHRHDVLVKRWAAINGPASVTVIAVDDSQPFGLLRTFEELLALPDGLLVPEPGWTNRSLTWGEIELLRAMNVVIKKEGWPDEVYFRCVTNGLVKELQNSREPAPDEPRITTPRWALERAAETGAKAAEAIVGTGVRIVGDISILGSIPTRGVRETGQMPEPAIPPNVSALAAVGAVRGSGLLAPLAVSAPRPFRISEQVVRDVTAGQLGRELVARAQRRLSRTVRPEK